MPGVDLSQLAIDRTSDARPRKARRSWLTRYILPAVLLFGFAGLVGWAARDYVFPPKSVTVIPVFSTTAEVRQEGTALFQAAGWIEPRPTPIRVAALAPGVVEKLLVVEDQEVSKGDPIAELVKDDARLAHDRALADLALRDAELEEARADLTAATTRLKQPVHLEAPLAEANAALAKIGTELQNLPFQLSSAEADAAAMQRDFESKQSSRGVVAGTQIDIARGKAEAAQAKVEELKNRKQTLEKERAALTQRRDALKTQLTLLADETKAHDSADARLKQCVARRKQAEVAVAEAKLMLERMTIRAPVSGRVYHLLGHPGSRLGSGMTQMQGHDGSTVVTLYRPDMLQVRVDVRFEDIPKVSLNQPVEIDNPALSSPLSGQVLFISSEADIQKNTLQVKVNIPSPPQVFKPEMLVDVTFTAPKQPESKSESTTELKLYVLKQLIQQDDAGFYVWLADQSEGIARKTAVETGAVGSNGLVEITKGLTIASRIISSNIDGLEDGAAIRVTSEDVSLGIALPGSQSSSSPSTEHTPQGGNH